MFSGVLAWLLYGSLALSGAALLTAVAARLSISRRHQHPSLTRRVSALEIEMLDALDRIDAVQKTAKKKYARDQQRERRANGSSLPDPTTDPEGWKKEMMRRHVLGKET